MYASNRQFCRVPISSFQISYINIHYIQKLKKYNFPSITSKSLAHFLKFLLFSLGRTSGYLPHIKYCLKLKAISSFQCSFKPRFFHHNNEIPPLLQGIGTAWYQILSALYPPPPPPPRVRNIWGYQITVTPV